MQSQVRQQLGSDTAVRLLRSGNAPADGNTSSLTESIQLKVICRLGSGAIWDSGQRIGLDASDVSGGQSVTGTDRSRTTERRRWPPDPVHRAANAMAGAPVDARRDEPVVGLPGQTVEERFTRGESRKDRRVAAIGSGEVRVGRDRDVVRGRSHDVIRSASSGCRSRSCCLDTAHRTGPGCLVRGWIAGLARVGRPADPECALGAGLDVVPPAVKGGRPTTSSPRVVVRHAGSR